MSIKRAALGAALLVVAASANATESDDFYFTGVFGQAKFSLNKGDAYDIYNDGSLLNPKLDDEDTSMSFLLGARINEHLSFEFGYTDLGALTYSDYSSGSGSLYTAGDVNSDIEVDGIVMGISARMPVSRDFEFYARGGLYNWDAKLTLENGSAEGELEDDDTDIYFGLGMRMNFVNNISLLVGMDRYAMDGDKLPLLVDDADVLSVGLMVGFE